MNYSMEDETLMMLQKLDIHDEQIFEALIMIRKNAQGEEFDIDQFRKLDYRARHKARIIFTECFMGKENHYYNQEPV